MSISENLLEVKKQIENAAASCGRAGQVKLVAVSKFHPASAVIEACKAGHFLFGENRVQEAAEKFDQARLSYPNAELHIIGQLQRNKVKEAVRIASCIQSVDRVELLDEIEKQCAKIEKKIGVLFEYHTGEESKSGFTSLGALRLVLEKFAAGEYPHITPNGFMTMAPFTQNEIPIRQSFQKLRGVQAEMQNAFPQFDLRELSMGMSGDYKIAIEEGSTMVRIGTAIFGERQAAASE